jgi:hypothetical protein
LLRTRVGTGPICTNRPGLHLDQPAPNPGSGLD